jgi:hypothetical protein
MFDSESELIDIINNITTETYYKKIESVKNNFDKAKDYTYSEDWIYNKYKFLF